MFTSLQSGEKSYLKLFDAIEKMEEYDEEKIKKCSKEKILLSVSHL